MKRHALILLGLFACTGAFAQAPAASDIAIQLLDRLDAHDYSAAESAFGEQMAAAVPADKLAAVWESLPAQAGAAQGRGTPVVTAGDGVQLVVVPLHYAKAELVAKVVVDTAGRIIGFLIQHREFPARRRRFWCDVLMGRKLGLATNPTVVRISVPCPVYRS